MKNSNKNMHVKNSKNKMFLLFTQIIQFGFIIFLVSIIAFVRPKCHRLVGELQLNGLS